MTKIRVVNGYIEIDYERVAQILPEADERTVREELDGHNQDVQEDRAEEIYNEAYETAEGDYETKLANFNDRIDRFFEKLLDDGTLTEAQLTIICEGFPSE